MTRTDAAVAGLISLALVAWLVPFASIGVDFHHDGIMLKPALDVLSGQALFRDTFMQYGALSCYLQVMALWIEPTLLCLRLLAVAAYGVSLFFLYASWRMILPRSLSVLACALFMLFIPAAEKYSNDQFWLLLPWSSVFAMMFQSIALYALFRVVRGEQAGPWSLVLGVTCAAVFWCRQPVGILMCASLVAIGLWLWWTGWNPGQVSKRAVLLRFGAGLLGINLLFLGILSMGGALPDWWYQNFVWPRKWVASGVTMNPIGHFFYFVHFGGAAKILLIVLAIALPGFVKKQRPTLFSRGILLYAVLVGATLLWRHEIFLFALSLRNGGWSALFPLVILGQVFVSLGIAFSRGIQRMNSDYYLVGAWAIFSLGSLPQYYPVADPWHVAWALAPGFGLIVHAFWRAISLPPRTVALAAIALFVPSLCLKTELAVETFNQPLVRLETPQILRGMKVLPPQAEFIGQTTRLVDEIVRHRPDIPSAMIGGDAMLLCLTPNRTNPTPYFVTWAGLADDATNQQRWKFISNVRPLLFLHKAKWDAVNDFYRRSSYVPLLYLPDEALEIAVPQELADSMGRSAYGAAKARSKP